MKEIAEKQSTEIGAALDPSSFAKDSGMGMENADKSSFAIPFISMLQGLSPQLETIEGSKPGMYFNSVTNELYKSVMVVPCAFQRRFIRWAAQRGGYKGEYSPIDVETENVEGMTEHNGFYLMDVPEGVNKMFDDDGRPLYDILQDTRNHFVLAQTHGGNWQPAIIAFSSTQIKKSKRWMSRIQGVEMTAPGGNKFNPPSFSHIYELKPVKEENSKGSWWGTEISLVRMIDDAELYEKAKAFNQQVNAGEVEVAPPVEQAESGEEKF